MLKDKPKTARKVKEEFEHRGISFAEWARKRGYKPGAVYDVLNGRAKGKRGLGHRIAVSLGLKAGVLE